MRVGSDEMRRILTEARVVAIVGLSDKPERDSHDIARYLQSMGYRIIPVNPSVTEVLGERSYPSLSAIPQDLRVDIVDIFRRSDQVLPIVNESLARGVGAIWMQLGVTNAEAVGAAERTGVPLVEDRCIKIEHHRLGIPARAPVSTPRRE
jgi:predicted CoA-binding protein